MAKKSKKLFCRKEKKTFIHFITSMTMMTINDGWCSAWNRKPWNEESEQIWPNGTLRPLPLPPWFFFSLSVRKFALNRAVLRVNERKFGWKWSCYWFSFRIYCICWCWEESGALLRIWSFFFWRCVSFNVKFCDFFCSLSFFYCWAIVTPKLLWSVLKYLNPRLRPKWRW